MLGVSDVGVLQEVGHRLQVQASVGVLGYGGDSPEDPGGGQAEFLRDVVGCVDHWNYIMIITSLTLRQYSVPELTQGVQSGDSTSLLSPPTSSLGRIVLGGEDGEEEFVLVQIVIIARPVGDWLGSRAALFG